MCRRKILTQAEWNVEIHIVSAVSPTSWRTLSFISCAALLVKVIARIDQGAMPRSPII
ncbi:hypothetical protein DSECCO2_251470 [anaerobic digester metagenome]